MHDRAGESFKELLPSGSFPGAPASSVGYGAPPQTQYPGMGQQAPPPAKQLTNQMGAMNLGNYGMLKCPCSSLLSDKMHGEELVTYCF